MKKDKRKSLKRLLLYNSILNVVLSTILIVMITEVILYNQKRDLTFDNSTTLSINIKNIITAFFSNEHILFFVISCTLFVLVVLIFIYHKIQIVKIYRYTMELMKGTKLISKGNYYHNFDKNEYFEIDNISHHLNDMLENIRFQAMRVEETTEVSNMLCSGLEKKVERRNAELEETNLDLQKTTETLQHAKTLLIQSEKMAALGELVAGISHEIKTPIGSLVTIISYMENELNNLNISMTNNDLTKTHLLKYIADMKESLDISNANIQMTDKFIDSLKKTSIDQMSMDKKTFNMSEMINDVLTSLKVMIKKSHVDIEVICDEKLTINSYPGAIAQIVMNLVTNSIKHGFYQRENGLILIKSQFDNDKLYISVKDNGNGIHDEHMSKLFDPFFTTARDRGGSGLGLNIIYNLIHELFDGSINCISTINEGVQFEIYLPISK